MFLGGDKFLHAPHTGDVVKVSSLDEPYYAQQFAGGRRFDDGAGVAAAPAARPRSPRPPPAAAAAPRSTRPRSPRPRPPSPATPPRSAATTRSSSRRSRPSRRPRRREKHALDDVPEGGRPVAGQAPRGRRGRRPAAAGRAAPSRPPRPPRSRRPRPPPRPRRPPREAAGVAAASIDLTNAATDYPGDNASQAELAKWLAKQAEKAGLPPELPVMASLVESGVKNLNFGDADSVGFFQMRVGIWNQGDYAGYPEKPELQAKWFIDQALAVKRKAIAARRRRLRQGPGEVRRVDRRRRAPRRAVPRPLPAAARRGAQAAQR